jgi:hypothetical protein
MVVMCRHVETIDHDHNLDHSLSASLNPSSPSTSTHQPSLPPPPLPPIAALKFACAYSRTSLSKLPGCSHTAGIPASFASLSSCFVTAGGVITESEYDEAGGSESAVGDGTVVWSRFSMLTVGDRGFMGVAGKECRRYHAKTMDMVNVCLVGDRGGSS